MPDDVAGRPPGAHQRLETIELARRPRRTRGRAAASSAVQAVRRQLGSHRQTTARDDMCVVGGRLGGSRRFGRRFPRATARRNAERAQHQQRPPPRADAGPRVRLPAGPAQPASCRPARPARPACPPTCPTWPTLIPASLPWPLSASRWCSPMPRIDPQDTCGMPASRGRYRHRHAGSGRIPRDTAAAGRGRGSPAHPPETPASSRARPP